MEPATLLTDLPTDVVEHIVVRLTLAHHIARIAPTCKVVSVAARNAIRVRQFSSEVVTLAGHTDSVLRTFTHHTDMVTSLALLPDGLRFVSCSWDDTACIVEHGLAPTTTSSEVKMMLDVAEAELRQAQEKVQRAQEKVRYLKQQLAWK